MDILIIEDEHHAAERLRQLVGELTKDARVLAQIDTVKKAVEWFRHNPPPDVVLMDIQLGDGTSFQIFEECEVKAPVIFTTAYEEYALKAFKVNSVDYILKPVDKNELGAALKKVKEIPSSEADRESLLQKVRDMMSMLTKRYKTRFVVKVGEHLKTVEVEDIAFFHSQEKVTFCITRDNRSLILDYTLEQLGELLDPADFFRINRQYLISPRAIHDIISYANSRLKIILKGSRGGDIVVARERVQDFKKWLDR